MTQSNLNQAGVKAIIEALKASNVQMSMPFGSQGSRMMLDEDYSKLAQAAISAYLECVGERKEISIDDIQDVINGTFLDEVEDHLAGKIHKILYPKPTTGDSEG